MEHFNEVEIEGELERNFCTLEFPACLNDGNLTVKSMDWNKDERNARWAE